jgi:hypothetical protein
VTYGTDLLMEEVSYVAYHFHWPLDAILDLEHPLRRDFVTRIGIINASVNAAALAAAEARVAGAGSGAGDGW